MLAACRRTCCLLRNVATRSLFSNCALNAAPPHLQFGFGIQTGIKQRRDALAAAARVVLQEGAGTPALRAALEEWLPVRDSGALVAIASKAVQVGGVPVGPKWWCDSKLWFQGGLRASWTAAQGQQLQGSRESGVASLAGSFCC